MALPKGRTNNPKGKPPGTINKANRALNELMAEKFPGYDPIVAMAEIANDDKNDIEIRLTAHKEVAKYTRPQLKSVEHTGDKAITFNIGFGKQ
jgi:hypothetical protein